jgi:hypothetical protein
MIRCEEYPGTQSILIPAEGIAHECITSFDDANKCNLVSIGIATAPAACNLIIFETPFLIGLYWLRKSSELLDILSVFE